MQTNVEDLPFEIWLIVFQYLEARDIFGAFQNLNSHFNRILDSNQLSLHVRLEETPNPNDPYWSDSVLNRITSLQTVIPFRYTYFLQFLRCHLDKLIRLQSLSIKTPQYSVSSIPYLCHCFKELNHLEYLSVTCGPYKVIFDTILALPTLRICQLILKESPLSLDHLHLVQVNSSIKQLFFVFLDKIDYPLINLLLHRTPALERLEISGSFATHISSSLFSEALFILPELRVLKFKLEGEYFTSDSFQSLHTTLPALKYFYFHYTKHMLPGIFLDCFIAHWWSVIEPIQRLNIHIKGHVLMDFTFVILKEHFQKNRQILSEKIKQSNEYIKFEWNEQDFNKFKLIEIIIVKN
jgi:hypothetical protein